MKVETITNEIIEIIGKTGMTKYDGLYYKSSKEDVNKIGFAVNPSLTAIKKGIEMKIDFMVTHHWIQRKDIAKPGILLNKKIELLAKNDISLACFHNMLDFSPIGNFESMARNLGLDFNQKSFEYKTESGEKIKVLPLSIQDEPLNIDDFVKKLENKGFCPILHLFNNKPIKRIIIDTGGGGFLELLEGIYPDKPDLYITGEPRHQSFTDARDLDINILYLGGHYISEKIGLMNIMEALKTKYPELDIAFIEDDNPY